MQVFHKVPVQNFLRGNSLCGGIGDLRVRVGCICIASVCFVSEEKRKVQ